MLQGWEEALAQKMCQAWREGKICLHPSDTLPGLSFDPWQPEARQALAQLKGRLPHKPFISLISSLDKAQKFWQPLPSPWEKALQQLWPGALSVVWQASSAAPSCLVSEDGSLGLRAPCFSADRQWMNLVLNSLACPFPSSSVNASGDDAMIHWEQALAFLAGKPEIYIPPLPEPPKFSLTAQASTVIRIKPDGSYTILRKGAVLPETIRHCLQV